MMKMNYLEKLIILLYGIDGKPFLTKFKFQKAVFLSILSLSPSREVALDYLDDASFYPHKFGPYSEEVEQKKEDLVRKRILEKLNNNKEVLSDYGRKEYESISDRVGRRKLIVISRIKRMINVPVPDEVLALLVYDIAEKYGYTKHSEIIDDINKNRVKYAIILYENGVVSKERASELARMSPIEFARLLMVRKEW